MTNFISLGSKITADSDCVRVKSFQSCTILCNPMDCSLPDSSVHEISQARIQEWVAISFSRHQMVNTEIRLIIIFAAKDGEALYSQQKQDQELTVAQITNSLLPNSDSNWRIQARREWQDIFKMMKEWTYNQEYSTQQDSHSNLMEKFYTVSKNKTGSWLWLRSWTPYCQIQT